MELVSFNLVTSGLVARANNFDRFPKVHGIRRSLTPLGSIVFSQGSGSNIDQRDVLTNALSKFHQTQLEMYFSNKENETKNRKSCVVGEILDY